MTTGANLQFVQSRNELGRLTLLIGAALALFAVLLLVTVAFSGWSANRTAEQAERQLIENALDDSVSRVLDEQKSVGWWDDAVTNVASGAVNTDWADVEFGAFLNETYGHDEIYVLNENDEPVYAYVDGVRASPGEAFAPHRGIIQKVVDEARGRQSDLRPRARVFAANLGRNAELPGADLARWSGHILSVDGKPAVVSAITILPNADESLLPQIPHLIVSVVPIDEGYMTNVAADLLLPNLSVGDTPRSQGAMASEPFTADDGASLGYLSWTTRQPGQPLFLFVLPLVFVGVAGAGIAAYVMMTRLKRAQNALEQREAQARHEALHDTLSSLPNRQNFELCLEDKLDQFVQVRNGERIIVAYIDVDRFKDVNDTLGHHAGDALIKSVAERLSASLGPDDMLARVGGDEFAVMRVSARAQEASDLAACLRSSFERPFHVCGQQMLTTASIGIATAPEHGLTAEELLRHADIALYQGKSHGRDRAMFFCSEMAAEVEQRREIEIDLRDALARDELSLHYQPLISCQNGKVSGLEALLRWTHPTKGAISPAVFVPVAEEAGLMPALGVWVLERAFADAKRWPDLEVAVNLSPVQFRHFDLVRMLSGLIEKHGVKPGRFVLEVTEGVLLESSDRNRTILESFRDLGFKIALDDFGTGYSSLRYLSDFRFDKIKIDRAFVTSINERRRAMTIIQSVVSLGRGLGMEIVAEGVETEAEATAMRLVGVSQLQGFYFSRPLPPERVGEVVAAFEQAAGATEAPAAPANTRLLHRTS